MPETNSSNSVFDLVIAGGGMAGSLLAWCLSQAWPDWRIAIIERQAKAQNSIPASFDSRSIALAAGSITLLQRWGLWPDLAANACPLEHIWVSDRGHFGKTRLSATEYQQAALGQVLEVEHLGNLLDQKLAQQSNITFFQPDVISSVSPTPDSQQIQLNSGAALSAKLLVIAEGGLSQTRQLAGFSVSSDDYQQTAIIANLALAQSHQHTAFERFTEHGPIALLPLTGQRYSLVWTVDRNAATDLLALDDAAFTAAIQQAFGYRAGIFKSTGARAQYPLTLRRPDDIVRHRSALLGNSLHNLHPIAGQGFNLAIRDIQALMLALADSSDAGADPAAADPGAYRVLRQYQQLREQDIKRVVWFTDALVRGFSNNSRLVALARNAGLAAMLLCDPLKRPLAMQAMGQGQSYAKY
ncbi:MAG: 2-octaprenyl-6-methoxyphenyl hydroxylase [Rheinheimera sp.]|uniref:2-octaprenyl-6-methoxyphenyl hydroxylase n=1 Tax=Arsukibacterium sp. UBA3155 TaxID=1946058 RepID=UPI000C8C09E5|nr:2-octaprenyl-6-methoxyphenyl hydroxylase [Arsukibacterium sp. UBA3155]MAD76147.1 2-octaprenyl-6-methoxyphenyl hydroxylase [Rheinheimera sp.]|tara:strand:- start:8774 stop:10009 length:1236 start_codon:yes stop_codon:yes gene_type:complete